MRIAWVTVGRRPDGKASPSDITEVMGRRTSVLASNRLRMLIPMAGLEARGHQLELLQVNAGSLDGYAARLGEFDAVVFKKTLDQGRPVDELFDRAVASGVPTLFDLCDLRVSNAYEAGGYNRKMLCAADHVVTSTPTLMEALGGLRAGHVSVITDPYEGSRGEPAWRPGPKRLKVLWFGHHGGLDTLEGLLLELVAVGRSRPVTLTLMTGRVSNLPDICRMLNKKVRRVVKLRHEEWSLRSLGPALLATDVAVLPCLLDKPDTLVKSPNRIVESLWAGRCVVANPLPAYLPFAEWAFIDDSIGRGLQRALDEQDRIVDRVRAAQVYIAETHSPEKIAEQWEQVIAEAVAAKRGLP